MLSNHDGEGTSDGQGLDDGSCSVTELFLLVTVVCLGFFFLFFFLAEVFKFFLLPKGFSDLWLPESPDFCASFDTDHFQFV